MSRIVKIDGNIISIDMDNSETEDVYAKSFNYENPQEGDKVNVFTSNNATVVSHAEAENIPQRQQTLAAKEKIMNKHVFIWVGAFLFGAIGVDRFMRGQIGLGLLKLFTAGIVGLWAIVDFIISLVKVYGNAFHDDKKITFINGKYAR